MKALPCFETALPAGFLAAGVCAGIKKSGKKDLALFYSERPCTVSAMFTTNRIQAAPIAVCREHLERGSIRSIVANSGNANCMNGPQGFKDARAMTRSVAEVLSLVPQEVLVSSTGVIGKSLPIKKITDSIPDLVASLSPRGLPRAAEAILTTDTFSKIICRRVKAGNSSVTISGVAKGAGMIAPHMKTATMLAYIFTDASVSRAALDSLTKDAVCDSFNAITVDGCMSTNDTVIVMANGASGAPLYRNFSDGKGRIFAKASREIFLGLAKMIVSDAEGATKSIEIRVRGAASAPEAERLAFSVANSTLFKCAMFGSDPNWGRIAAALGAVLSSIQEEKLDISLNGRVFFQKGVPRRVEGKAFLEKKDVFVDINLHQGKGERRVYTCDLSYDYVKINADYS